MEENFVPHLPTQSTMISRPVDGWFWRILVYYTPSPRNVQDFANNTLPCTIFTNMMRCRYTLSEKNTDTHSRLGCTFHVDVSHIIGASKSHPIASHSFQNLYTQACKKGDFDPQYLAHFSLNKTNKYSIL